MWSGRTRRGRLRQVNSITDDYANYKKCGEITVSPDEKSFGLSCVFCSDILLEFKVFVKHVRNRHAEDLRALYEEKQTQARMDDELTLVKNSQHFDKVNNPKELEIDWSGVVSAGEPGNGAGEQAAVAATAMGKTKIGVEVERLTYQPEVATADEEMDSCLVYILEEDNDMSAEMEMEEEIVDSFEIYNGGSNGSGDADDFNDAVSDDGLDAEGDGAYWQADKVLNDDSTAFSYVEDTMTSAECDANVMSAEVLATAKKKRKRRTPKLRDAFRNKELVGYLLDAYKANEKLWNPNHPHYKYNARRSVFDELSGPLLKDLNYSLTGVEIFTILKELRGRYRRDLTKLQTRKSNFKSRLWCFDKLDFLRHIIENKRAEREAKHRFDGPAIESEQTMDSNSDTTKGHSREVLSYILEAYKRQEMLWNPQHPGYLNCDKRAEFQDIAAQLLEDRNVLLTGEECSTEVQKLRIRYRKEMRISGKCNGFYKPKLWCFEQMDFLRESYEDKILQRLSKRKNIVRNRPRSSYIKADAIEFGSVAEQLSFIEIYRNYTSLWDVDHPDYRSTTYRDQALQVMLEELNSTFNMNANVDELHKSIFQLRKDFSAEKQKQLTKANTDTTTSVNLVHAKLAEFLNENLGPFRCEVCEALIRTSDRYKEHKSSHDGTLPFICTICGKGFQKPCNLTVHIRRHKRDFPYSCGVCDKRCATSTEVAIHMRSHTGERPYICDLCGKSFKTWSFFDTHRRAHVRESNFMCPICDKLFYEKNRFTDHMNCHLNIRKHDCKKCGKSFTTCANLKKHSELHLAEKKYKCTDCNQRFAQFSGLHRHRRITHATVQGSSELEQ